MYKNPVHVRALSLPSIKTDFHPNLDSIDIHIEVPRVDSENEVATERTIAVGPHLSAPWSTAKIAMLQTLARHRVIGTIQVDESANDFVTSA